MRFKCAGNAMVSKDNNYGNLVYIHTNSSVMVWVPNKPGKLVFVGGVWGDGEHSISEQTGRLIIKMHNFNDFSEYLR